MCVRRRVSHAVSNQRLLALDHISLDAPIVIPSLPTERKKTQERLRHHLHTFLGKTQNLSAFRLPFDIHTRMAFALSLICACFRSSQTDTADYWPGRCTATFPTASCPRRAFSKRCPLYVELFQKGDCFIPPSKTKCTKHHCIILRSTTTKSVDSHQEFVRIPFMPP